MCRKENYMKCILFYIKHMYHRYVSTYVSTDISTDINT